MYDATVDFNSIRAGMDVCDLNGETIGTVDRVQRAAMAAGGPPPAHGYLVVKTGLLGLGKHYYVPTSAIEAITSDCVCLSRAKDDPAFVAWETQPPGFADAA
jgi:hypothetical protein